ncbi:hypothetical protein RJ639_035815 [Escallonia herrerae]|uniref:Gag protein n=1 Tax=Escallonia herrerae TaxID=1293975 RepID=A0AA89BDJ5_9ASTE|nr:hypothetical protein RJ639_035815 [Escallonia herrerae]
MQVGKEQPAGVPVTFTGPEHMLEPQVMLEYEVDFKAAVVDAWKHSDFLCKNYILNGLDNTLYNVYCPMVNAKALWESLERKYKTEDAGSKKFVVGKFLDFKMVDSKTVIGQVQEFQLILHDIHAERMEMKLENLIVRLRIEEDNRQSEKKAGNYHHEAKANVVEQVTGEPRNTSLLGLAATRETESSSRESCREKGSR